MEISHKLNSQNQSTASRPFCYKCFRPSRTCLCNFIKPFDPKIKIHILIHPMEARKQKLGTSRLAHLALKNSAIEIGVDFSNNETINNIIQANKDHTFVLYPAINATDISKPISLSKTLLKPEKLTIFVIDGTWPCAKKIMRLSKNLQKLPALTFTPKVQSKFIIKQQPDPKCLSTIEAIFYFLDELNNGKFIKLNHDHKILLELLEHMVNTQIDIAANRHENGYRRKPYTDPRLRKSSIKWKKRNIFF